MHFQFDEAAVAFQEEVRAFIRQHLPDDVAERQRRSSFIGNLNDEKNWARLLSEQGWSTPRWPVEYGGTGWTPLQHFLFEQEMTEADAPKLMMPGVAMVGPVIYAFGSEAQKSKFLPSIRTGEYSWCQGFSEPGAGSDLASLRTTAVRQGDRYIVNGQKIWTSGAFAAAWGFFLLRTDTSGKPQQSISFLLIDMTSPGITVRRIPQINGEAHLCEVFLDNVEVPLENMVGEEGAGWTYAKFLLDHERTSSAFIFWNKRELRRAKELAKAYSRNGVRLRELETFRLRIAELEARVRALEWSVLRVLANEPRPYRPTPVASALKVRGANLQQSITELQMDLLGARALRSFDTEEGFAHDFEPDIFWRDDVPGVTSTALIARAATIYGGTEQVQKNIIARQAFGL